MILEKIKTDINKLEKENQYLEYKNFEITDIRKEKFSDSCNTRNIYF